METVIQSRSFKSLVATTILWSSCRHVKLSVDTWSPVGMANFGSSTLSSICWWPTMSKTRHSRRQRRRVRSVLGWRMWSAWSTSEFLPCSVRPASLLCTVRRALYMYIRSSSSISSRSVHRRSTTGQLSRSVCDHLSHNKPHYTSCMSVRVWLLKEPLFLSQATCRSRFLC